MPRQLETCPRCRALLDVGAGACSYCGEPLRTRPRVFSGPLRILSQAPASAALFLAILVCFGAEVALGGGFADSRFAVSVIRLGGNITELNVGEGETWRLLTAIFLHFGVIHILFNGWALVDLAPFCERVYGTARFVVVYLATGIAGNIVSWIWHVEIRDQSWLQAGASGSLCGLLGLLMVFRAGSGWDIEADMIRRTTGRWLLFVLAFGFLAGADNAAHLGGAAAGAGLGLFMGIPAVSRSGAWMRLVWRPAAAALVALTLYAFGAMIASQSRWQAVEEAIAVREDVRALGAAFDRGEAAGDGAGARATVRRLLDAFAMRPLSEPALAAARDDVVRTLEAWVTPAAPPATTGDVEKAAARFAEAWDAYAKRHSLRIEVLSLHPAEHEP